MKGRAANDANVAALGEAWKGGGEGKKEIIVVTLGTGVGGGIIIDGAIVEGLHGAGGEIGHMHVDDNITALCNCGHSGCLEQVASATGIARLAREELALHPEYTGDLRTGEVTAKAVFDAYKEKGNPGSAERFRNIWVVYTREAQTADAFIEKTTLLARQKARVRVVTSDRPEQLIASGNAAMRTSAREFHDEVNRVRDGIAAFLERNNKARPGNTLEQAYKAAWKKKAGGRYVTEMVVVKQMIPTEGRMVLMDGRSIEMNAIIEVE
jgi:predicted RNA-binding protein with PIN domain